MSLRFVTAAALLALCSAYRTPPVAPVRGARSAAAARPVLRPSRPSAAAAALAANVLALPVFAELPSLPAFDMPNFAEAIPEAASAVADAIPDAASAVADAIPDAASAVADAIPDAAASAVATIPDAASTVADSVVAAIPDATAVAAAAADTVVAAGPGYSQASYYTVLALYVLSFPGIYSLVKRSVKSKVVKKTYELPGPAAAGGRVTREVAADVVSYFQANNYKIKDAGQAIIFEGVQAPLAGRAAFLTFCTFIAIGSLALVLTIVEQQVFGLGNGLGNIWYLSTLVSPIAGKYYLDNAERSEEVSVKLVTEDDESITDLTIMGDDEEVERFQKTLDLREKGMVYVKGLLE